MFAWAFADADPYRAATHNKGIMNGITPADHCHGQRFPGHGSRGSRVRRPHRPIPVFDPVGGKTTTETWSDRLKCPWRSAWWAGPRPCTLWPKCPLKIMGPCPRPRNWRRSWLPADWAKTWRPLRALAAEGIQRGHMSLHAKNIAIMAGAAGDLIDQVAQKLVEEGKVRVDRAKAILAEMVG